MNEKILLEDVHVQSVNSHFRSRINCVYISIYVYIRSVTRIMAPIICNHGGLLVSGSTVMNIIF